MIAQPLKLATPAVAVAVLPPVQDRVAPLPGWAVMARATGADEVVMVLPPTSWTVTTGWVVKAVA